MGALELTASGVTCANSNAELFATHNKQVANGVMATGAVEEIHLKGSEYVSTTMKLRKSLVKPVTRQKTCNVLRLFRPRSSCTTHISADV